jgi:anti-sigma factor RsiW
MTRNPDLETERQVMRLVHGELPERQARELARRIEREPELRRLHRRHAELWAALEPPPAAPVPPDFAAGVLEAVRRETEAVRWSRAPAWARAGAAAALVAGIALGASVGVGMAPIPADGNGVVAELGEVGEVDEASSYLLAEPLSLAESYWLGLDEDDLVNATESADGEGPR